VQIAFAGRLSDEVVDGAIAALDLWAGSSSGVGNAPAGIDPRRSGRSRPARFSTTSPRFAQAFDGPFRADPSAFDAVTSYALGLVAHGVAVSSVVVR